MNFSDLFLQFNQVQGLWDGIAQFGLSVLISYAAIIFTGVAASFFLIRKVLRDKRPEGVLIGEYDFVMPLLTEKFTAEVYHQNVVKNKAKIINAFMNMAGDDRVAALFESYIDKAQFYLLKYKSDDKSTRTSGMALMITNADLTHQEYCKDIEIHRKLWEGNHIQHRVVSQAHPYGFIRDDVDKYDDQYTVDYIWYPLQPLVPDAKTQPAQISPQEAEALLAGIAHAKQMMITLQTSKEREIEANAASERADRAESLARRAQAQVNHERRQRIKQHYWAGQLTTIGTPLSLGLIIAVMGGCAVFLPDLFARWMPGYQSWQYIGAAVLAGAVGLWFLGNRANSSIGGE